MTNNKIKIKALYDLVFYYKLNDKCVLTKLQKNKEFQLDYEFAKILAKKKCIEVLENIDITPEENKSNKPDFDIFVFLYYIYKLKEFTIAELKRAIGQEFPNYDEEKLNRVIDALIKTNRLGYSQDTMRYVLLNKRSWLWNKI